MAEASGSWVRISHREGGYPTLLTKHILYPLGMKSSSLFGGFIDLLSSRGNSAPWGGIAGFRGISLLAMVEELEGEDEHAAG